MLRKFHNRIKNLTPVEVVLFGLLLGLVTIWLDMNFIPGGLY